MAATWSPEDLERISASDELHIAVARTDGTLRRWTPIWVVTAGADVYVRTWYRRETGWFGHVRKTRWARIRVTGFEADVTVEDVGEGGEKLRAAVDAAYEEKYGRYGRGAVDAMVAPPAAASTLRLIRAPPG